MPAAHRRAELGRRPLDEDSDVASQPGAGLAQPVHEPGPAVVERRKCLGDRGAVGLRYRFQPADRGSSVFGRCTSAIAQSGQTTASTDAIPGR